MVRFALQFRVNEGWSIEVWTQALALGSVQGCYRFARVLKGPGKYGVFLQVQHKGLSIGFPLGEAPMPLPVQITGLVGLITTHWSVLVVLNTWLPVE